MRQSKKKVIIAMSGGVDSSVAAALLTQKYDDVVGVMLSLWSDTSTDNMCCTPESMVLAQQVASQIKIPFFTLDARQPFREKVVEYFISSYRSGDTPNPCVVCNQQFRWDILMSYANEIGATYIATGHYARLRKTPDGYIQLLKGLDASKDQSYVLHGLSQEALSRTILPLGDYLKTEIRNIAKDLNLPVATRPDSQDLCFVGNRGYRDFLIRHTPEIITPGPIINRDGEVLGEHQGLAFYTIGQRKGLGISATQPFYVLHKRVRENQLVVGTKKELGREETVVERVNWISGVQPHDPFRATVKIRYKARQVWGWVVPLSNSRVRVQFDRLLRDITPGQSAVFYQGEVCLGGGKII